MKKISAQDYLYYSEEFQLFLRSQEQDVRGALERWPKPTVEGLVIKYRGRFGEVEKVRNGKRYLEGEWGGV